MITFHNPGTLDRNLITLFGHSVKPNSTSPIGFFGTGLKYAIAVCLRLGQEIKIQTDTYSLRFEIVPTEIRGQEAKLIHMIDNQGDRVVLPFTLELGKHWELWMAYRELWCNAKDEGGGTDERSSFIDRYFMPGPMTVISVSGEAFDEVHSSRSSFLLETSPIFTSPELDIHEGESSVIFYRGIRALTLDKPAEFTYNIKATQSLSEDRTIAYDWNVKSIIAEAVQKKLQEQQVIRRILTARSDSYEGRLSYPITSNVSSAFVNTVAAERTAGRRVNPDAFESYKEAIRVANAEPEISCPHFDSAIEFIEMARSVNTSLRNWGYDLQTKAEELAKENGELQERIEVLEEQLRDAQGEIRGLETQLEVAQELLLDSQTYKSIEPKEAF